MRTSTLAVLSVALNLGGVSLSHSFLLAIICWGANGYVLAAAWPALGRTLHNGWPRHERGKAMDFYLLAAGFSSSHLVLRFLGAGAVACVLLPATFAASKVPGVILLALAGILVYGPQSTDWARCPELVGRERAGTATGLMDASAYAFAALGQLIIGRVIDSTQSVASAFAVIAGACVLGAIAILPVRK